jgi:hypothetical protein
MYGYRPPFTVLDEAGWDLAWPESFREVCFPLTAAPCREPDAFIQLHLQGVEVVIAPTCWVYSDIGQVGERHDPEYV